MAENKTINIKINQNADKAEKSFKSYNKELGNTKKQYDAVLKSGKPFDQQLEDINRIVKETPLNVRDMNKQIQAYQSIALSAGRETPVGRKALEEAAALRDRYIDIQNETKRLADDQRTLEGAMQGVATGVAVYGGIQSAMALSGVESEKLRETLVKLQAAQTLMNSINQVATAFEKESALMLTLKAAKTKAVTVATAAYATVTGTTTGVLKAFRIALASTGIGLLVVGIGLLIANFEKVTKVIKNAIDVALVPVKAAIDAIVDAYYAVTDALGITSKAEREREKQAVAHAKASRKRNQQLMEEYSKEKEAIENNIEATKNYQKAQEKRYDRQIELLQAEGKETTKIEKLKLQLNVNTQKKILQDRIKGLKEAQKTNNKITKIFAKVQLGAQIERLKEAQFKELKFDKETNKIKLDNYREYQKNRLDIARQIEDLENELLKDGIEKDLLLNEVKFRRLRENAEKNTKLTAEERKKLNDLYLEQEKQSEAEIRLKYFNEEKALLGEIVDFRTELRNKEIEDNKKAADSIIKTNEIARKKDLENEKAVAEAKKGIQDAQIANVEAGIALLKDVAGENNKLQALAIAAENAVGIAKIIISTQAANAAAKLKYAAIPGGLALAAAEITANKISAGIGIAASVAAAAKGIASLKQSAPLDSGGDLGSGGVGSEAVAPEFNVVGDAGINQLAQLQQTPTQAFVVSGEVTSAQALDRNRVTNATL